MQKRFSTIVKVGSTPYYCCEWSNQSISHVERVGFDCETEMIADDDPTHIPKLALLTHHDDKGQSFFIHPDNLADWVFTMKGKRLIGHNVAFDFWVISFA